MSGPNLLVVDWDYFFPNPMENGDLRDRTVLLYEWKHTESIFGIDILWGSRANGFLMNDLPLPYCKGYEGFWDRFKLGDDPMLLVGDSNLHAGNLRPDQWGVSRSMLEAERWGRIDLYDAHHDCGYRVRSLEEFRQGDRFDCEDWMLVHAAAGVTDLHVHYPAWRDQAIEMETAPAIQVDRTLDDGQPVDDVVYDLVYLCRSGAWVPPWCDGQFAEFYQAFPGDIEQIDSVDLVRDFDLAEQQMQADWMREQLQTPTRVVQPSREEKKP